MVVSRPVNVAWIMVIESTEFLLHSIGPDNNGLACETLELLGRVGATIDKQAELP